MIGPLAEIEVLAKDAELVTTAIIAPEDHELMLAVKDVSDRRLIEPVLIGCRVVTEKAVDKINSEFCWRQIVTCY